MVSLPEPEVVPLPALMPLPEPVEPEPVLPLPEVESEPVLLDVEALPRVEPEP